METPTKREGESRKIISKIREDIGKTHSFLGNLACGKTLLA